MSTALGENDQGVIISGNLKVVEYSLFPGHFIRRKIIIRSSTKSSEFYLCWNKGIGSLRNHTFFENCTKQQQSSYTLGKHWGCVFLGLMYSTILQLHVVQSHNRAEVHEVILYLGMSLVFLLHFVQIQQKKMRNASLHVICMEIFSPISSAFRGE